MLRQAIVMVTLLLAAAPALAEFRDELIALTQSWAAARYEASGDERKDKLRDLIKTADTLVENYSEKADSHLWAGAVRCSLAELEGKLAALALVKECRTHLEHAMAIDAHAEDGYVYGILGTLYAKVPGWPLAFGDKKKAEELLQKGVEIAPTGMNTNYFYAKFLFDQGDIERARIYVERARQAPPPYPPEESLPVAIRQREIRELSDTINANTN